VFALFLGVFSYCNDTRHLSGLQGFFSLGMRRHWNCFFATEDAEILRIGAAVFDRINGMDLVEVMVGEGGEIDLGGGVC